MSNIPKRQPYKIVSETGSYEILKFLEVHGKSSDEEMLSCLEKAELVTNEIKKRLFDLQKVGFIHASYSKRKSLNSYTLTSEGKEAILLIDVINGAPLSSVFAASTFRKSDFTLITQNVTGYFIEELSFRRDFSEIFICSPWIRLMPNTLDDLSHIIGSANKITGVFPRIHILTRPVIKGLLTQAKKTWNEQISSTLSWFEQKGADINYVPNLHTKLFIIYGRDFQTAIFGSENLTDAKNIELGIRITAPQIVDKLYIYWEDIYNNTKGL